MFVRSDGSVPTWIKVQTIGDWFLYGDDADDPFGILGANMEQVERFELSLRCVDSRATKVDPNCFSKVPSDTQCEKEFIDYSMSAIEADGIRWSVLQERLL